MAGAGFLWRFSASCLSATAWMFYTEAQYDSEMLYLQLEKTK